jgi:putative glycerol-1-phosphate prenyltransferase
MTTYDKLLEIRQNKRAGFLILIDPDKFDFENSDKFFEICKHSEVDAFLIGGSLLQNQRINEIITIVKSKISIPAILFPGSINQVVPAADAILFLSLISGRNSEHLIGKHILAAPLINYHKLEAISTGYILIESGQTTTAEYMSGTKPIPYNKPEIATATALAGEFLGMKMIYLEAGSGAEYSVSNKMIKSVKSVVKIPIIVGGGIRDASTANEKVQAGADFIVIGNHFENQLNWIEIKEFGEAIHNG